MVVVGGVRRGGIRVCLGGTLPEVVYFSTTLARGAPSVCSGSNSGSTEPPGCCTFFFFLEGKSNLQPAYDMNFIAFVFFEVIKTQLSQHNTFQLGTSPRVVVPSAASVPPHK